MDSYVKLWEQHTLKHSVIHSRILKDIVKNINEKNGRKMIMERILLKPRCVTELNIMIQQALATFRNVDKIILDN